MRGNGLGLSWENSIQMESANGNKWIKEIHFVSEIAGYSCCGANISTVIPTGTDFKLQFYATFGAEEIKMIAPTIRIPLPHSETSTTFDEPPTFTFHPSFTNKQGRFASINVTSMHPLIGTRNMAVYLPPSFMENPLPVYDAIYAIDISIPYGTQHQEEFDALFSGIARDAIIIGHGDWRPDAQYSDMGIDRVNHLTPVS